MGKLADLRTAAAALLSADAYFSDVTVLTEQKANIDNEIERALATLTEKNSKIGVVAVVITPLAAISQPNLPGPYLDPITLVVHIEESVTINNGATGTLKPASDIAEKVLSVLHRVVPTGFARPLIADRNAISAAEPVLGDLAYDVRFTTQAGLT